MAAAAPASSAEVAQRQAALAALESKVAEQGELVRKLKADKAPKEKVDAEVATLKKLKSELEEAGKALRLASDDREEQRRGNFETLLTRKLFVIPSFEIYGGVGGLYDFGPPGCAVMMNLQALWRRHFVLEEDMLEISGPAMTPEVVLKASGHVDKFTDFMVRDEKTNECYRADKLLEGHVGKLLKDPKLSEERRAELQAIAAAAGSYKQEELGAKLRELKVLTEAGNPVTEPFPFNLMFQTQIGPTGKFVGYLRPETAQGIFVNFRRLLEYNSGCMPFAAAQIGPAFRNEIAPRAGLLRVREFTLAEIEHFVHPDDKSHPKFPRVANTLMRFVPRELQDGSDRSLQMTIGEALAKRVVGNETLAYFLARTHLFLLAAGVDAKKLRFRQHRADEMAHYASDCWDAEIFTTYGWVECVGHADRSAYDLTNHTRFSKVDLNARETFEPREEEVLKLKINRPALGKLYGKKANDVVEHLNGLTRHEALELSAKLAAGNPQTLTLCTKERFEITKEHFSASVERETINSRNYVPHVIEPSFGLGRIIYAILEHAFDDTAWANEKRAVLRLRPVMAPFKVGLLSLSVTDRITELLEAARIECLRLGLANKLDNSSVAIGKKYARQDELGTPFCMTVDFQSEKDGTVTLRERDSTEQVRGSVKDIVHAVAGLTDGSRTWQQVKAQFPAQKH